MRLSDGGRIEIVRTAPPEDAGRLRATAAALRAAAGTGAVEVLTFADDGATVEVVLAFAGRAPSAPLDGRELARIGSAIAAHLADLHLRGIAHGALIAEHVLLDASGEVRLCGFGASADATSSDDVRTLGTLLDALLDEHDRSDVATTVRATAVRCRADGDALPSMAAIAAALASAHGPRRTTVAPRPPARRRRGRGLVVAAAAVAIASIALATLTITRTRTSDTAPPVAAPSTTVAPATSMSITRPIRIWPAPPATTIAGDGATWTWGTGRDRSLLGDWDCDGVDTPALVQPSGDLWVIDEWPAGDEATARYVTNVDDLVDARVEHGPSCDAIAIVTADGRSVRPLLTPA